jgi:hypothetical protein
MPDFPLVVGRKPNHATVFLTGGGKFLVKWKQAGKWRSTTLKTLDEAKKRAESIVAQKKDNQLPDVFLTQSEAQVFDDIRIACAELGISVATAFQEFCCARSRLPSGYTLTDAVQALEEKQSFHSVTLEAVCGEFIDWKEKTGNLNAKYLRSVKACLKKLAMSVSGSLSDLTPKHLNEFVNGLDLSPVTINHYIGTIRALLTYAVDHQYLSPETRLLNSLKKVKSGESADNLMSPDEFEALFSRADYIIKGRYFLTAFCGLRVEESQKWTIDDLTDNYVIVSAKIAKKSQRRAIEVPPAVCNWLRDNAAALGLDKPISEKRYGYYNKKAMECAVKNILRHSHISYAYAATKNINAVAANAGTSPEKIKSNYLELTDKATGHRWFALRDRIISM